MFKRLGVAFLIAFIILTVYLNRSYAHIFDYSSSQTLYQNSIEKNYKVTGGTGTIKAKYIALGDSLTYGLGASDYKSTFPYILSTKLLKKYQEIDVVNLGVPGAVIQDLLKEQLPRALTEQPDLVTIMIGTNDVRNYEDPELFKSKLTVLIDSLKKNTKARIILINIPYLGTASRILPPHDKILDNRIKEFNKIIEETANQENIQFEDLYTKSYEPFKTNPKFFYSVDEFHPSNAGYILWGNMINAN